MKKMIVVLLTLILAVPVSSYAVTGSSPFFGEWIGEEHHAFQTYDSVLHYLFISGNTPCTYYKMNMRHGGIMSSPSIETETMYDSNWEIIDDHLRVPTSGISYIDVYYDSKTDTLYTKDPKVVFVKIP